MHSTIMMMIIKVPTDKSKIDNLNHKSFNRQQQDMKQVICNIGHLVLVLPASYVVHVTSLLS